VMLACTPEYSDRGPLTERFNVNLEEVSSLELISKLPGVFPELFQGKLMKYTI